MKENIPLKTIILLACLVLFVSCQANEEDFEPPEQDSMQDNNNDEKNDIESDLNEDNNSNQNDTDQENDVSNDEQAEEAVNNGEKYRVNPNNFLIEAVDEDNDQKIALLTFDDTPTGIHTQSILDTLDKYDAKAIFFVNGHYAQPNVDDLIDIHERGHIIGNHTWWHINVRNEDAETIREEIISLGDFIEETFGERPVYYRPPFGVNTDVSKEIIREEGMQTMNWSNGSLDWDPVIGKSSQKVADQILDNMHNGANILFHDKEVTANALDQILSELIKRDYSFVLPTEVILPGE